MNTRIDNNGHGNWFIEVAGTDLLFRSLSVADSTPTGNQILAFCDLSPREEYVVLQWLPSGDLEELRADETVCLDEFDSARFVVARSDRLFRIVLNDRSVSWPERKISDKALRHIGRIAPEQELYISRKTEADQPVPAGGEVLIAELGVENIYSKKSLWRLNVQGVPIESSKPVIAVRSALVEAGFDPDQGWIIVLKSSDEKRQITLEESIDLSVPGIEKLRLTPREINNGDNAATLNRDFRLLASDEDGLTARGLAWQTIVDGGHRWLLLSNYPLPPGFNVAKTTIGLDVPPSYPSGEIDMFFCAPHLERLDRREIPQTQARASIQGSSFQRWSRHRGQGSRWRPGVDNVLTHLALVEAALLREVEQ